ncbi:MAG TPA: hypothetical protein VFX41_07530, partial [Actinomycetales bacterium]|nr:hypothetical protein [Actinomycetales bacterium]
MHDPFAALRRRRLGDVLVEAGMLTGDELLAVLNHQRESTGERKRLGELLVELGFADERSIAGALARHLGMETVDLSRHVPAPDVVRLLPRTVADRNQVLVIDRTPDQLVIATADPTNVLALDDVKLHTGISDVTVLVSTPTQIRDQLARAWSLAEDSSSVAAMMDTIEDDSSFTDT